MAIQDLTAVEALQWAPSGRGFDGIVSEPSYFLAGVDGKTRGYGYGPGWSIIFSSEQGDISLEPRDWLVRLSDGSVVVEKERPQGAKLFSVEEKKTLIEQHKLLLASIQAEDDAAAEERYWGRNFGNATTPADL